MGKGRWLVVRGNERVACSTRAEARAVCAAAGPRAYAIDRAAARPNPDVNALLPRPRSPGTWVNETECSVCGAKYKDFRAGCGFREGAQRVRDANGGFAAGGGFRSRGPVLWGMKVCKLDAWYLEHLMCGAAIYEAELKKKAAKLKRRKKAAAAKKAKVAKLDWDQARKHLGEDPF